MKKKIERRITLLLVISLCFVVLVGTVSIFYFSTLSKDIDQIIKTDIIIERSAEKMRVALLDLKRIERVFLEALHQGELPVEVEEAINRFEESIKTHQNLSLLSENTTRLKELDALIAEYSKEISRLQNKANPSSHSIEITEKKLLLITNKMHALINEILEIRYDTLSQRQEKMDWVISNAKRNMLFLVVFVLGGGTLLIILAPRRVTAPFRKYIAAIHEIEDLKFGIRLPIKGDDEVAQLGKAMNHLIEKLTTFDEIKEKRIRFDKNKQRVLMNMIDQGVMIISKEGDILSMNSQLTNFLNLDSAHYEEQDYHMVDLPEELKEMIKEALKSKEKVNSRMMILNHTNSENDQEFAIEVLVDIGLVRNYKGDVVNLIFTIEDISHPRGASVFKRISLGEEKLD